MLPARVSPVDSHLAYHQPAPKRISLDLTATSSPQAKAPHRASVTIVPGTVSKAKVGGAHSAFVQREDDMDIL